MKRRSILIICAALLMAVAAMAVFADEPVAAGITYTPENTVFVYENAEVSEVSVMLYATLEETEEGTVYSMTKGENGLWTATIEGDLDGKFYTYAYTVGEEITEIPDPVNTVDGALRSAIEKPVAYELWVAGVQVTSQNAGNVLGEKAKITFDAESNILKISGTADIIGEDAGIVYKGSLPLTIQLSGDVNISGENGAIRSDAALTITADTASVLYAKATGAAAGVAMGDNTILTLTDMALLHTTGGAEHAGLSLGSGSTLNIGNKSSLITLGDGSADDIAAADEDYAVSVSWLTGGRLIALREKLGTKVEIDGEKYTVAGYTGRDEGIVINGETPTHSVWLTGGAREIGLGYVACAVTEESRKVTLFNAKIDYSAGPALTITENAEVVLRGVNELTGAAAGLEVKTAAVSGCHGILKANGIRIGEAFVVLDGALELESDVPFFGEVYPDLSQYRGEYSLITDNDEEPEEPQPEEPETPETEAQDPENAQTEPANIEDEAAETAPEEKGEPQKKDPCLFYKLIPVQTHEMDEWVDGYKADCMSAGMAGHRYCKTCQLYVDADGFELAAAELPVDYDNHSYIYTPQDGDVHAGTCIRSASHTMTQACYGGVAVCLQKNACDGCGDTYGRTVYHDFSGWYTESNELGHWTVCRREGCGVADDPKAHTGGVSSCTESGYCSICGYAYAAPAHSFTTKASEQLVSEATCKQPAAYRMACDNCEAVHETLTVFVGETLPHTYDTLWSGNNAGHWRVCTVCGSNTEAEKHVEKVVGRIYATKTEPGYTGDVRCEVCDALVFQGSTVPPLSENDSQMDIVLVAAVGLLAVSGLGFAGVIVYGAIKKKKEGN